MPLSEYEQRVLEQMERQLTSDDPKLASTLHGRAPSPLRRWILAGAGFLAGLAVLVAGAAASLAWLGVLGFVAMFVSVLLAFSGPRRGPVGVVGADGTVRSAATSGGKQKRGLLSRLEDRWERRRQQRG